MQEVDKLIADIKEFGYEFKRINTEPTEDGIGYYVYVYFYSKEKEQHLKYVFKSESIAYSEDKIIEVFKSNYLYLKEKYGS